jgi:putative spermidine/putrescine transport system substrate-binding protein
MTMMTLRTVTRSTCGLVLVGALAGCGSDDGSSTETTSLTFTSWGGVYQDAQVEAFIEPFRSETGVQVHDDPTLSYAKVKTMVDAGNVTWDVVTVEGFWAVQQCGELLEPLDSDVVDLSGIDPALMQSDCGAPLLTYLSTIYYNTQTFPDGADHPQSCADFFDTERFAGKRGVYSSPFANALLECALIADGATPDDLYPLDLDRAFDVIETIKDDVVFWNIGADSEQLMTAGEVDMLLAFNGRAYAAIAQQGAQFDTAYSEAFLHYDALAVPKGVRDSAAAMELIDFMMDAERQATLTTLIPYPPANREATLSGLSPALEEFLPNTNPDLADGVIVQDQRWWAEHAEDVVRRWEATFQG